MGRTVYIYIRTHAPLSRRWGLCRWNGEQLETEIEATLEVCPCLLGVGGYKDVLEHLYAALGWTALREGERHIDEWRWREAIFTSHGLCGTGYMQLMWLLWQCRNMWNRAPVVRLWVVTLNHKAKQWAKLGERKKGKECMKQMERVSERETEVAEAAISWEVQMHRHGAVCEHQPITRTINREMRLTRGSACYWKWQHWEIWRKRLRIKRRKVS